MIVLLDECEYNEFTDCAQINNIIQIQIKKNHFRRKSSNIHNNNKIY